MRFLVSSLSHAKILNNLFWVMSIFISAENCPEFSFINQIKMNISTLIQFLATSFTASEKCHFPALQLVEGAPKPRRGARFGNIREGASHTSAFIRCSIEKAARNTFRLSKRWGARPCKCTRAAHSGGPKRGFYFSKPSDSEARCPGIFTQIWSTEHV